MVILIGGEKGGTGKTTIATNLAALRALAAHDILLVDRSQLLLERALVSAQLASRANASRVCSIRLCADNSVV